jgi:hypothetical protein
MNIIDKTFMVCVRFLMTLGRFTHLTYKQISVIFNLWIQGIVLLLASITPLAVSICKCDNIVIISMLAVYSIVCTYTIIRILRHYMLPLEEAFDLCVADLLRIAERWERSYNYVNIALFVVLYLMLIGLDIVLTYLLLNNF